MVIARQWGAFCFLLSLACGALASEWQIKAGVQSHSVDIDLNSETAANYSESDQALSLGLAMRAHHGKHNQHLFGFGIDIDSLLGDRLLGLRALDYEYQIARHLRAGAFFGIASLDSGASQNGYYTGLNASLTELGWKHLDLLAEWRFGSGLARDRLLESDPEGESSDIFLDFSAVALCVRLRF